MSAIGLAASESSASASPLQKPIPVILDSDMGDDIDDTWALGLLLRCPELDLKLVLTDFGKPEYRAKLTAKLFTRMGHGNIPVGLGVASTPPNTNPQEAWCADFALDKYRGKVHQDGVKALIDLVMKSKERITIIAIGPVTNLAAALDREPRIAERANIVGMHGSVRRGYGNKTTPDPEWNVLSDIKACQRVFTAAWPICITPLDTCGRVNLGGERYQKLLKSSDPIAKTVLENYEVWERFQSKKPELTLNQKQSSTLFDTVAVYLAATQKTGRDLIKMETLGIRVDDKGFTREEANAKRIEVATEWKNLDGFYDLLVDRLTRGK
jgi:inosine-uridine nucleoside N-ribohydrolase